MKLITRFVDTPTKLRCECGEPFVTLREEDFDIEIGCPVCAVFSVDSVRTSTTTHVEVSDGQWTDYVRHAPDNWEVRMGESLEPIYNETKIAELEGAYQAFLATQ